MIARLRRALRRWLGYPVDCEALLREAKRERYGDHDVLTFKRPLSRDEMDALAGRWERTHAWDGGGGSKSL